MSPFCGATDTPVSDFWWRLLWVSKPEWVLPYLSLAEVYILHYMFPEIHLWCDTCWPLGIQHGSCTVSSTYLWGIGGAQNRELLCCRSQCKIRQTLSRLSYPGSACFYFFVFTPVVTQNMLIYIKQFFVEFPLILISIILDRNFNLVNSNQSK